MKYLFTKISKGATERKEKGESQDLFQQGGNL